MIFFMFQIQHFVHSRVLILVLIKKMVNGLLMGV